MKSIFYSFETKSEPWVEEARAAYLKKISAFIPFEIEMLKSPPLARDDAESKKRAEAEKLLSLLRPTDLLVLFDEKGKMFTNSEAFASTFGKMLERSPARMVFLIGGAFGVDEAVRKRAQSTFSFSGLTFNHWVAQIVALEQIYRALTILKGLPYHNR